MTEFSFNANGVTEWQYWTGGVIQLAASGDFGGGTLNLVVTYQDVEPNEDPENEEDSFVLQTLDASGASEGSVLAKGGLYRVELVEATSPSIAGVAGVTENKYYGDKNNVGSSRLNYAFGEDSGRTIVIGPNANV